jgi:5-oxoprolinase (ATP-hydrolysing)
VQFEKVHTGEVLRGAENSGLVRRIACQAPMTVAVLSNHRRVAPFGLAGGSPGATGINRLVREGGESIVLPACATEHVEAGDEIVIETPGGGGFG